ncbi:MAG: flagellar hook-length control protein FliK [Gammaproteobacteria bacterium]
MAVPEALLNAIGASGPTSKNPLEKLVEAPFSGADGPSFSSVMREASSTTEAPDESAAADESPEAGKALPDLPELPTGRARLRLVPASDQKLEEFAVGMGIDRDLARLLLSETADSETAVGETADIDQPETSVVDSATPDPTAPDPTAPSMVPTWIAPTQVVMTSRTQGSVMNLETEPNAEGVALTSTDTPATKAIPVATTPITTTPSAVTPIVDEDLLLWRSRLSSATAMLSGADESAATAPVIDRDTTNVTATPALSDTAPIAPSTMGQLRARSATISTATISTATMPTTNELPISARVPSIDDQSSRDPSEPVAVRAVATDRVVAGEKPVTVTDPMPTLRELLSSVTSTAMSNGDSASGDRSHKHAGRDEAISAIPFPVTVNASPTAIGEASRVLSTPDPKLSFGERVQAFADAVAQRVLGQIRNENWSVSLQLDPANLGAMDIDLTMRGNAVAATVGVANSDVRALLESGLPRLRESLESAGLQLAGWTFGQSGSRAFSEPARKMFSQTSYRSRVDDVDSVAEISAVRRPGGKDLGSGAVDLFV